MRRCSATCGDASRCEGTTKTGGDWFIASLALPGLIDAIEETDESEQVATVEFTYDTWGRLIREQRTGADPTYDLEYTYDAGGNRLTKSGQVGDGPEILVEYHYDLEDPGKGSTLDS